MKIQIPHKLGLTRTFSVLKAVPSIIQDEVARAEGLSAPSNVSSDSD